MRLLIAIVVLCLAVSGGTATAATFRVNSGADSHDASPGDGFARDGADPDSSRCTLRAAIEEANALPGPDTILVPAHLGSIRLSLGTIYINDDGTVISGENGRPTIDAVANPTNHTTFIIQSDSNVVR
jgi:CSLREA domain-containing protein